mmetsp:Transcript_19371/g.23839  ORF Transcript_19371/g.23839 Transcript_19371/m.23839 type:complete len:1023 (+) Transcript_19371:101-3169(+)
MNEAIDKLKSVVDHFECPICIDNMENTLIIPDCCHRFCGECIKAYLRRKDNDCCPTCRGPITTKYRLRKDEVFDNLLQILLNLIADIEEPNTNISESYILDYMKNLAWHYSCPLCFQQIKDMYVSSDCLHRFCKDCILQENVNRNGNKQNQHHDSNGLINSICPLPCCGDGTTMTAFFPDKQFDSIIQIISDIRLSIERTSISRVSEEDTSSRNEMDVHYTAMPSPIVSNYDTTIKHEYASTYVTATTTAIATVNDSTSMKQETQDESPCNHPITRRSSHDTIITKHEYETTTTTTTNTANYNDSIRTSIKQESQEDTTYSSIHYEASAIGTANNHDYSTNSTSNNNNNNNHARVSILQEPEEEEETLIHYNLKDDNEYDYEYEAENQHDRDLLKPIMEENDDLNQSSSFEMATTLQPLQPKYSKGTFFTTQGTTIDDDDEEQSSSSSSSASPSSSNKAQLGKIIGFDGIHYQIHFPQTNTFENFTETQLDQVYFKKIHKRPSSTKKQHHVTLSHEHHFQNTKKKFCCPTCKQMFSSNMHVNGNAVGNAPVQSQNCSHVLCTDCIQAIRIQSSSPSRSSNSSKKKKMRSTVDCPICHKSKSFNAENPIICSPMCNAVQIFENMQRMRKTDTSVKNTLEQQRRRKKDEKHKRKKREEIKKRSKDREKHKKRLENNNHDKGDEKGDEKGDDCTKDDSKKRKRNVEESQRKAKKKKSATTTLMKRCGNCKKEKNVSKFSSKQLQIREDKSHRIRCRRCEEKSVLVNRFGSEFSKFGITLFHAKTEGAKPKFLSTMLPLGNDGHPQQQGSSLPSNITVDCLSRPDLDPWSIFRNPNIEQEKAFTKANFWCTGDVSKFLEYLREKKQSSYGTFILPDQTDGFFVIPFDQTPVRDKKRPGTIIKCKFILGIGVVVPKYLEKASEEPTDKNDSSSKLRNLIAAEYKSNQSLAVVPKGSVKAARKISSRPEGPSASYGVSDWFRKGDVIEEAEEDVVEEERTLIDNVIKDVDVGQCDPDVTMSSNAAYAI